MERYPKIRENESKCSLWRRDSSPKAPNRPSMATMAAIACPPAKPTAQDWSLDWMNRCFSLQHIPYVLAHPVILDQAPPLPSGGPTDAQSVSSKCSMHAVAHPPQCMCSCLLLGLSNVCEGAAARKRLRSSESVSDITGTSPLMDMNAVICAFVPSRAGEEASAENATQRVHVKRKFAENPVATRPVLPAPQSVIALSSIRSLSRSELASFVADVVDGRKHSALT